MKKTAYSYKEFIRNIDVTTHLHISYNEEFIPQKLKTLTGLTLGHTDYVELPSWLQVLTNLEELEIGTSNLSTLPDWLPQLKNLKVLRLQSARLKSLPAIIHQMKQLEELDLSNNILEKFPSHLELPHLKKIDLSYNTLLDNKIILDTLMQLPKLVSYALPSKMSLRYSYGRKNPDVYYFDKFFAALCKKRSTLLYKNQVHPQAIKSLCWLFQKKFSAVQEIAPTILYTALHANTSQYRKMVLEYLYKYPLNTPKTLYKKRLAIVGKLTVKRSEYTAWLEDTGAILDKKIGPFTDFIVLGEKPGKQLEQVIPYQEKVIVEQMVWDLKETPYLQYQMPEVTQNLQELLQNPAIENLEIALQMMELGGMPPHLVEEIVALMLFHTNNSIRKKATLIFNRYLTQHLSIETQKLLQKQAYRIKEDKKITQFLRELARSSGWDLDLLAYATYRASGKTQAQGLCLMSSKVSICVIRDYINRYEELEFKPHNRLVNGLYLEHIPPAVEEISKEVSTIRLKGHRFKEEDYLKLKGFKHMILNIEGSTKIPYSIFQNTQLEKLDLTAYRIRKLSALIGNLTHLKELKLFLINVTTLPKELRKLQKLKRLTLSIAETNVPLCIGELSALEYWFMGNPITNFPKELEQLNNLKSLNVKTSNQCPPKDAKRLKKFIEKVKARQ